MFKVVICVICGLPFVNSCNRLEPYKLSKNALDSAATWRTAGVSSLVDFGCWTRKNDYHSRMASKAPVNCSSFVPLSKG